MGEELERHASPGLAGGEGGWGGGGGGEAVCVRVCEGVGEMGGWVAGCITPPPTHTHSLTWACAPAMQCAA